MNWLNLSNETDNNGLVDFLGNKHKHHYINMGGSNNQKTIDSILNFLIENKIWEASDHIVQTKKLKTLVPDRDRYNDISFVLHLYDKHIENNKKETELDEKNKIINEFQHYFNEKEKQHEQLDQELEELEDQINSLKRQNLGLATIVYQYQFYKKND